MIEIQETDGAWPYEGVYRLAGEIPVGYRVGGTAIVCQALLESKLENRSAADESIKRGVALILKDLEHPSMQLSRENHYDARVWGHSYSLDLFCRLKTHSQFAEQNAAAIDWIEKLVAILMAEELEDGGWNYASRNNHACFVTAPAA